MKKRKTKILKRIIIFIILISIAGAVVWFFTRPNVINMKSEQAEIRDIFTYYSFGGNVEPKNSQNVITDSLTQISELKVKEGSKVKEGDVLYETSTGQEVEADIDGTIDSINVQEDEIIAPGTLVMQIIDFNNLQITARVDEYDLKSVKKGNNADILINAIDKEIKGKVSKVSNVGIPEPDGVTYFNAIIDIKRDSQIKIGMNTEIKILHEKAENVVTLPMAAIQFDNEDNPYVMKKDDNDAYYDVKITVGINDGTIAEIKEGIQNGETIYYPNNQDAQQMRFGPGRR